MRAIVRIASAVALGVAVGACSLSSLTGAGKTPAHLFDLTPDVTAAAATRSAAAGEIVTIRVPVVPRELKTTRVPVQVNPIVVEYLKDMTWVDTPDRLFQNLLEEMVRSTTGRVVLDPSQSALDPGLVVTGQLQKFGFDAQQGTVVVQYDASLATQGGTHVQTRRFVAALPADGTAATVGPALNQAANQIAREVAAWIGG
ncbi:MAG: membrane integrity-associated transporter subunit PqiC [Sphingomonas sp.]|nr:membrane integrity-associated transporter subunit PqiC [Sphingomonas sp.]